MPKMSLLVVINGPVAIAGSIPFRLRTIGTKVPISAETIITQSIDKAMVRLKTVGCWLATPKRMTSKAKAPPFINPNPTSLNKRLSKLPLTTSFASPCTIIADD